MQQSASLGQEREIGVKTILVPVEHHPGLLSTLDTALLVGRMFSSYIEGFALGLDLPEAVPIDLVIGLTTTIDPQARRETAAEARRRFESFASSHGLPRAEAHADLSFGWLDGDLRGDTFLGEYGRIFDLTVVGRPDARADVPRMATLETALFETGRPILIAPPEAPKTLGETVVIAWNHSTETARTVADAAPFLARAKRIVVLSLEGWFVKGPTGEDLARMLRRQGLPVETKTVPNPGNKPGETILSASAALGCDLLIKGAYTQSRLRQMIFGGATSHILSRTTIPVLMAH